LWDRVFGKPKQDVSVSGGLVHAHTRDPFLATLARSYDEVLAKDVQNSAQQRPHNQIESKPAIEAEVVHSVAKETGERALKRLCSSWVRWRKRSAVQCRFKAQSIRAAPYHFVEMVAASKFAFESLRLGPMCL
jgi:hypothetical protein